jgi:lipopolysaccharide transport system ATP-binding protein
MGELVIKAENVSKRYRLGILNSGSLKQDMIRLWKKTINPKHVDIMEQHERISAKHVWALKDVNFEIRKGEVLGFVGKNGAGKSTLLKILSRVTLPTTGSVKGVGRIASLLEVGTGFHPELTGRENVFLNGQILGMKKKEIIKKFDEIVNFSGVEKFIDTPVKRYSSGMYVRLSFAVAAHLDPDILIVDEALAVGDTEFQAKCIGKMKDVSSQDGKTILFVSHNMPALRSLCKRAICIDKGRMIDDGTPDRVIANYLIREKIQYLSQEYEWPDGAPGNYYIKIKKAEVTPVGAEETRIMVSTPLQISLEFWQYLEPESDLMVGIHLYDFSGACIFDVHSEPRGAKDWLLSCECTIPGNYLSQGSYYLSVDFIKNKTERAYYFEACLSFDIQDRHEDKNQFEKWVGFVRPDFPVTVKALPYDV